MLLEALARGDKVSFLINDVLTHPTYTMGGQILSWGTILLPVFAALVNPWLDILPKSRAVSIESLRYNL